MPQRTRTPHSRVSGIRRPRVAGHTQAAPRVEAIEAGPDGDGIVLDSPPPVETVQPVEPIETVRPVEAVEPVDLQKVVEPDEAAAAAAIAPKRARRLPKLRIRIALVPLLAVALVVLTALAVVCGVADARLRGTPSASNAALVDVAASTAATEQLTDALKTVFSYDYARLDENEKAARAVITSVFGDKFSQQFAVVRQVAPQQQAVVTATIPLAALRSLDGDHAVLVAFMDQTATRAATGGQPAQLAAMGRLTVTGEKVDGRWKIADVDLH